MSRMLRYAAMALSITAGVIIGLLLWETAIKPYIDPPKPAELIVDINHKQAVIDEQYSLVLEDVHDVTRYVQLRKYIDECIDLTQQYNRMRLDNSEALDIARCDRIFP